MAPCSRQALRILSLTAGALFLGALLLLAFGPGKGRPVPQTIQPQEALAILSGQDPVSLVDVRTQVEYDQGHIEGALLIPHTELAHRAAAELPDREGLILLYCRSGNRSSTAAGELLALGYTRVYDLGGITGWPYALVT